MTITKPMNNAASSPRIEVKKLGGAFFAYLEITAGLKLHSTAAITGYTMFTLSTPNTLKST
jgi:hypothetical protein